MSRTQQSSVASGPEFSSYRPPGTFRRLALRASRHPRRESTNNTFYHPPQNRSPPRMQAFPRALRTAALARSCAHRPFALIRSVHATNNDPSPTPSKNTDGSPSSFSSTTHFGFRTVPEGSKESLVRGVFDSVASSYDLMNDAMSLGVHRLWKDSLVSLLRPGSRGPVRCIDVAGGTGDIALRILDYARETHGDRETRVDVVDINGEMLREGSKRFKQTMYHNSARAPPHCHFFFRADDGSLQRHRSLSLRQTPRHCPWRHSPTTLTIFTPSRSGSGMSPRYRTSFVRHTGCSNPAGPLPASNSTKSQTPYSHSTFFHLFPFPHLIYKYAGFMTSTPSR
jgi:hypothetical protein